MALPEFKKFQKIEKFANAKMAITQKLHGTNATILVWPNEDKGGEVDILAGSRERWLLPGGKDNFGFGAWVYANKEELIRLLGIGKHDGEWAGLGINSGEGLLQKGLYLFDWWKWPEVRAKPAGVGIVPLLYNGEADIRKIDEVMEDLRVNGSKLVPGYMRPEGVVINLAGHYYKKVFDDETTQWRGKDPNYVKPERPTVDCSHLLQPIRLEKLLSRDEQFIKGYPKSLPLIAKAYIQDLIDEGEFKFPEGTDAEVGRKCSHGEIFKFIKTVCNEMKAAAALQGG